MPGQRTGNMDNRSGFGFDLTGSSSKFIDAHHLEHYSPYQRKSLFLSVGRAGCNAHHSCDHCDHKTSIPMKGEWNFRQDPFYEGRVQINLQALDI